ncbi:MAG: hypothetical protein S4CHLAM81_01300 [Chlamydiales bacterium]|nr:hypothetical protein [Chlamydiales bacterium]MCH9634926.1 hypothetical protein [Chlamydiales bacterium]
MTVHQSDCIKPFVQTVGKAYYHLGNRRYSTYNRTYYFSSTTECTKVQWEKCQKETFEQLPENLVCDSIYESKIVIIQKLSGTSLVVYRAIKDYFGNAVAIEVTETDEDLNFHITEDSNQLNSSSLAEVIPKELAKREIKATCKHEVRQEGRVSFWTIVASKPPEPPRATYTDATIPPCPQEALKLAADLSYTPPEREKVSMESERVIPTPRGCKLPARFYPPEESDCNSTPP